MSQDNGNNDKLLNHDYDGIQELDNNLPTWWLWTFFITIIFGFLYWLHFSFTGSGWTLDQYLAEDMKQIEQMRAAAESGGEAEEVDEATLLADGQRIYNSYCSACHKADGGGSVGPNLTDAYWLHGQGDETSIKKVVTNGVLSKGMPAWKEALKPKDLKSVIAFVMTFKNKNVPNGKAPQGDKVE